MLARSSKDDNLRSGFTVCRSLLGATACVPRNSLDPQCGLPPTDEWSNERVNQFLEDMLRACVIEYQGSWDKNLPLGRVLVQQQLPGESKNGTI
jgi:hypothetical protein